MASGSKQLLLPEPRSLGKTEETEVGGGGKRCDRGNSQCYMGGRSCRGQDSFYLTLMPLPADVSLKPGPGGQIRVGTGAGAAASLGLKAGPQAEPRISSVYPASFKMSQGRR